MDLGKKIAYYRKNKDITQDALAKQLGISNQAVSKWETNQSCPDIELLPRIVDIFGITLDELFERSIIVQDHSKNNVDQAVNELKDAEKEGLTDFKTPFQKTLSLPWGDDEKLHAVLFIGHRLIQKNELQDNENNICKEIIFHYEGAARNIESAFNVNCGVVEGSVTAGGYVECGNVGECVTARAYVECGDVGGCITAGAYVECGNVGECVTAGAYVECGNVRGNVTSQSYMECGSVQGSVSAEGNVYCGDIVGDVKASGNIDCGDISGCIYKN